MEGKNLTRAQQELADLLAKYRETEDPALLEEIQRKMAELEAAFNKMFARMAQMRKEMGEEFMNIEAMEGPGMKDILEQMEKMRDSIQDGDVESMLAQAEDFLNSLGEMMAALEESAGEYGDSISAEALRRMDDLIDRLSALEEGQQELVDKSEELYHDRLEKMAAMEDTLNSFIQRESEKMDELRDKLSELQNDMMSLKPRGLEGLAMNEMREKKQEFYKKRSSIQNRARVANAQVGQRKKELEQGDLDDMIERMRQNQASMEQMQKSLEDFLNKSSAGPKEKSDGASSTCNDAAALGREILDDMEGFRESLREAVSSGESGGMEAMSDDQEGVRDQTLNAWEELEDLSQDIPTIPMETGGKLEKASLSMRDASGYLLLDDPGRAVSPGRDAKHNLGQAKQDLMQARKQLSEMAQSGGGGSMASRGGQRGGKGGTGGFSIKNFKIPEEGEDEGSQDIRGALLKAMREDAPEEYRNLNNDYYERLMR
jgi:hypothetical protein